MNWDAAWALTTRLGEAQILLPAMAAAVLWLAWARPTRPLAAAWTAGAAAAVGLTTASKVAFIGWAVGVAAIDFTGFSGHSMSAALVLPVLARLAASRTPRPWPRCAIALGYALAATVAVSRVMVGAHSVSEVVTGFALGAAASAVALRATQAPAQLPPRWLFAALALWLIALPVGGPPSNTHGMVTALALRLSGNAVPYTRQDMHRDARLQRSGALRLSGLARSTTGQVQGQPVGQR